MESYSRKILAAAALLLAALITSSLQPCSAARRGAGATSTAFIKRSCSTTAYPALCFSSLSSHASAIQQSPKLLAHTALSVSVDTARATSADLVKLSRGAGMSAREVSAMRDCVEELRDSVERLNSSMTEMNEIRGSNFGAMMSDIQTWVSAALTDVDTCMDGFAGNSIAGGVKAAVREKIVNVAHATSNGLALINSYAALHG